MAFKNKETGKWTAQWYEIDIYGKRKQMKKRGFTTCREAKAYERQKKLQTKGNLDMTLVAFAECYFQDKENELKEIKYNPDSYLEIGGRCEVCISRNCANCPHVIK